MGICKQCGTDILEGEELCSNCSNGNITDSSNESYLDNLLDSVINTNNNTEDNSSNISRIRRNKVQPMDKTNNNTDNNVNQFEEDQDLDLNNIFDFMDMVGSSDEEESFANTESDIEESHEDDTGYELSLNEEPGNEEINDEEITDEEINDEEINNDEEVLALDEYNDNDDFNELLNFLSNEEDDVSNNNDSYLNDNPNETRSSDINTSDIPIEDILNTDFAEEKIQEEPSTDDGVPANLEFGSNIGDVFDHALGGVDSLEDPNILSDIVPEELQLGAVEKKQEKEKKKAIFKELFNKTKDEEQKEQTALKKNKKPKKSVNKKKAKKVTQTTDNEKEVKNKKSFLSFLKKDKNNKMNNNTKKKLLKPKKVKKIKTEEVEIDTGKINKVAVIITFTIFLSFAGAVIVGKDIVSYSTSITRAGTEFERQRYNYAYKEIRGIEVKPEDIELYDKIMTVMYVNKQLNSYHNYYANKAYPEALDSLLKGLRRYEKNKALAISLGIEDDINYIRIQIVEELKNNYQLTEKDSMKLAEIKDQKEYSINIYQVVNESKLGKENKTE